MLDAVVQSSDRVFLIAKKTGQTNAFFFDEYGQQILTLEVAVGADLSALDQLLTRLIPGSNVHSEIAGKAIVLTGTVRTPIDSNRAAQIAAQFAQANRGCQQRRHRDRALTSNTTSTTTTNIGRGFELSGKQRFQHRSRLRRRRRRLRGEASDQPPRRRGRRAGDAARQRRRGAAHHTEAVRHQRRRARQLRQLHHRDPVGQRPAVDRSGARRRCRRPASRRRARLNLFMLQLFNQGSVSERRPRQPVRQLGCRLGMAIGQPGRHRRPARPRARRPAARRWPSRT